MVRTRVIAGLSILALATTLAVPFVLRSLDIKRSSIYFESDKSWCVEENRLGEIIVSDRVNLYSREIVDTNYDGRADFSRTSVAINGPLTISKTFLSPVTLEQAELFSRATSNFYK